MSRHSLPGLAILAAALIGTVLPAPVMARERGRSVSVQGAHGHGYSRSRDIQRQPGQVSAHRSLQTNGGRGYQASRNAQWGNGNYNGARQIATNDGRSASRMTSATNNGDGTASYASTLTGPNGGTRTISGTAVRNP